LSAIKVGDLVMVIKVCCDTSVLGVPFSVENIVNARGQCGTCGKQSSLQMRAEGLRNYSIPFGWLRKIPPLSELEGARDALSERTPTKEKA
jgi:hypothetical protein